jgi:hypothetical protein
VASSQQRNSPGNSWKRPPALLILVAALAVAALGAGYYWRYYRQKPPASRATANAEGTSSLPPFETKEPQRYQATRITTSRRTESGAAQEQTDVSRVAIARDGDKRREDYDLDGLSISYLELSAARYALLPAQKIYADLNNEDEIEIPANLAAEFSPDRLLNESLAESRYELLGKEILNGRSTTRYRVTTTNVTGTDAVKTETLIWIDQSLHLPLKAETVVSQNGDQTSFTTELQNLSEDVSAVIFELPSDFRKVSAKEFERQLRSASPRK